ncbi:translation initiation factor IF-3 [Candidatus Annandia pinicola]|uniref:translation initiation factor IF-3 n=1 Tax=Candidatus Annandia pinicola TaxID=1345117 RepID=UPI001D01E0F3|nr:translation initiation factor IF-3 [Candidatus Annandia pinicola]UDG80387.1 Translation initiation factor IF-3 [Candidatus Annandia pinicola]
MKLNKNNSISRFKKDYFYKIINKIEKKIKARLTGLKGEQIGLVLLKNIIFKSYKLGLDLVKISSNSKQTVYRIVNYKKFVYKKCKSSKFKKKKKKIIQTKEIKFRPNTDKSDYIIKLRNLVKFLKNGCKTKITLKFRGREIIHKQIGIDMLNNIKYDLKEISILEFFPTKIEGRQMIMMLSPKKII